MKKRKIAGFAALRCLCCLALLACGDFGGDGIPPSVQGGKSSSSSSQPSGGESSSSSGGFDAQIGIEWQNSPEESIVHGAVNIFLDPFMASRHLITQGQYKAVMGVNPAKREKGDSLPVEGVSWFKAVEFCQKLSELNGLGANAVRLPTEAEWEFMAYARAIEKAEGYREWTNDCYDSTFPYAENNPSGPPNCIPKSYGIVSKEFNLIDSRYLTDPDEENDMSFRVVARNEDFFQ